MDNIYNYLTEEEKKLTKTYSYEKGDIVFHEETPCEEIGIVLKGKIKISTYSYQGKEIVYNHLEANDVFGNNLIFSSDPTYRGDILVLEKTEICFIKKNELLTILGNNQNFLIHYLKRQSDFGKSLNSQIKILGFESAEERFLYYLSINDNKIKIKSVTELAERLFLSRETVSRLISKLEEKKEIKYENKIIEYIG